MSELASESSAQRPREAATERSEGERFPIVDAHMHVWDLTRARYGWLTPDLTPLHRSFGVADAAPELVALGVGRVLLVQAADEVADTENMLAESAARPEVAGVVAWVPLTDAAAADRLLDGWPGGADGGVVGVRHLVHREPGPRWLLRPDVQEGLAMLSERGLVFEVCAETPPLLALVPELAARHPQLRLVVDHLGKPPLAAGDLDRWAGLLADAAAVPTVAAKVSGLNTAAGPDWDVDRLRPAVEHAVALFGPRRLMIGSDWPFALLAGRSYTHVWTGVRDALDGLAEPDQVEVFGGTAVRTYGLVADSSDQ